MHGRSTDGSAPKFRLCLSVKHFSRGTYQVCMMPPRTLKCDFFFFGLLSRTEIQRCSSLAFWRKQTNVCHGRGERPELQGCEGLWHHRYINTLTPTTRMATSTDTHGFLTSLPPPPPLLPTPAPQFLKKQAALFFVSYKQHSIILLITCR